MEFPKSTKKRTLQIKYEESQFEFGSGDKLMLKKEEIYASLIGTYLIRFSNLEHTLELGIAGLINDNNFDEGYVIIKDLDFSGKIELFYNITLMFTNYTLKRRKQKINRLNSIKEKLQELSILRNKIAHAKWYTLDSEGYIRVDTKMNKESGLIKFRKFKLTTNVIKNGINDIKQLNAKLAIFLLEVRF
ncbi:MAG TPA: hypothetical protein VK809_08535 [Bacteroidia bacterium]|jgi:hypothetical protein|nr:hypothetical protein [Bacteroidia bacterium]